MLIIEFPTVDFASLGGVPIIEVNKMLQNILKQIPSRKYLFQLLDNPLIESTEFNKIQCALLLEPRMREHIRKRLQRINWP